MAAGETPYATRSAQLEATDARATAAAEQAAEALQAAQEAAAAAQQTAEANAATAADIARLTRASEETTAQIQALVGQFGQFAALLQQGQRPQHPDSPPAPPTEPAQTPGYAPGPPTAATVGDADFGSPIGAATAGAQAPIRPLPTPRQTQQQAPPARIDGGWRADFDQHGDYGTDGDVPPHPLAAQQQTVQPRIRLQPLPSAFDPQDRLEQWQLREAQRLYTTVVHTNRALDRVDALFDIAGHLPEAAQTLTLLEDDLVLSRRTVGARYDILHSGAINYPDKTSRHDFFHVAERDIYAQDESILQTDDVRDFNQRLARVAVTAEVSALARASRPAARQQRQRPNARGDTRGGAPGGAPAGAAGAAGGGRGGAHRQA